MSEEISAGGLGESQDPPLDLESFLRARERAIRLAIKENEKTALILAGSLNEISKVLKKVVSDDKVL